jgi:predicted CoA-binding protein
MHSFISKQFVYAIVGASNNTEKYGHRVLKDLYSDGYKVIPVNLREKEILGLKAYENLSQIPEKIDVAVLIIPPLAALEVLKDVAELKINKVWLQPGSESAEAIPFCNQNDIEVVHDACIMVVRRLNP